MLRIDSTSWHDRDSMLGMIMYETIQKEYRSVVNGPPLAAGSDTADYIRALILPKHKRAELEMVHGTDAAVRTMAAELCEPEFRERNTVHVSYLPEYPLAVYYTIPSDKEAGRGFRWRCSWGAGYGSFLAGPAVMVAVDRETKTVKDFSTGEFGLALTFDPSGYREEKMIKVCPGDKVFLEGISDITSQESSIATVISQDWQILLVSLENVPGQPIVPLPKTGILKGHWTLKMYPTGTPLI